MEGGGGEVRKKIRGWGVWVGAVQEGKKKGNGRWGYGKEQGCERERKEGKKKGVGGRKGGGSGVGER